MNLSCHRGAYLGWMLGETSVVGVILMRHLRVEGLTLNYSRHRLEGVILIYSRLRVEGLILNYSLAATNLSYHRGAYLGWMLDETSVVGVILM